jgi:hypothetical protein
MAGMSSHIQDGNQVVQWGLLDGVHFAEQGRQLQSAVVG